MLRRIVIIVLELSIGLTICAAVNIQITSYEGIQNVNDFDHSPFEKIGDSYYIIETTENLSWFEAAHKCRKKGGNLASIESEDELRALYDYTLANYPDHKYFWLSGNDLGKENQFQWLGTGQPLEYANWRANEPNDHGDEDCVYLQPENDFFIFNDIPCTSKSNYICEADNPKQICITVW